MEKRNRLEELAAELIDGQNLSFIGSVDEDGYPTIRAMLRPRLRDGVETIWFSTNNPTDKVRHFQCNAKACVYFCDSLRFRSLLLKGEMAVRTDPEAKGLVWREGDEMYYPGGADSEDYVALRFRVHSAEIYGNFAKEVVPLD